MTALPSWWEPLRTRVATAGTADFTRWPTPPDGGRPSAVLILLGEQDGAPDILLLERSATMRTHAGQAAFVVWKTDYRSAFYERLPFVIPAIVPQTNDVNDPEQGTQIYEACVEASVVVQASEFSSVSEGPRVEGCVTLE